MHVALTGATGVVGEFVLAALLKQGCQVTALSRSESPISDADKNLNWVVGDVADIESQEALLLEADALVHCAFSHAPGRYRGGEADDPIGFWRDNTLPTLSLLKRAQDHSLARVILLSSRAVFDATPDQTLSNNGTIGDGGAVAANSHYGAVKIALEQIAATVTAQSDLSVTTLRPTGVYGMRRDAPSSKWYDLAVRARESASHSSRFKPDERVATEVHGADVARAVLALLRADDADVRGRVFNCSDILLSRRELYTGLKMLAEKRSTAELFSGLYPDVWPKRSLRCDNLLSLGWRPGGRDQLISTLTQLTSAVAND